MLLVCLFHILESSQINFHVDSEFRRSFLILPFRYDVTIDVGDKGLGVLQPPPPPKSEKFAK